MKQSLLEDAQHDARALDELNAWLDGLQAEQRVIWALAQAPGTHVLSSSFGAQAAVSLHLLTRQRPDLPIVLIDTGYLFSETYRFIEELRDRLSLNVKVYSAVESPAWLEAREGRLWEQGVAGIERYNQLRKVGPMQRALSELDAGSWFAGLRRSQARTRAAIPFAERRDNRWKFHPSLTGPTETWASTCVSTVCRITRYGSRVTSPLATCTPRIAGNLVPRWIPPVFLA